MNKKVLIADDSERIRTFLKEILLKNGYEIAGEAVNGKEAVELYKTNRPDLVAMDLVMPELNGIQALKDILAFDPEAKVIMVTGQDEREAFQETIKAGAVDHITKPFNSERVLFSFRRALEMQ